MDAIDTNIRDEARSRPRSNIFLSALLQDEGGSIPVRVRNMSAAGALVEAAAVPGPDTPVRLVRGGLAVGARVVWSADRRCGLRFDRFVTVADWLAPAGNAEQHRIDEAVRLLKLGAVPLADRPRNEQDRPSPEGLAARLADDLRSASRLIEILGSELAADAGILERHGNRLQNLDIAVQTIVAVADSLPALVRDDCPSGRLENLRSSYARALSSTR